MSEDKLTSKRKELEQVLVRQFKLLKEMNALTAKERTTLLNDPDAVLRVVEEKEAMLDAMTLLEDRCRNIVQELSLMLGLRSESTSIQSLLSSFAPEDARLIQTLSEGISSLASQTRESNRANQAIAITKLDWLKATQSFLISLFLPETGYQPPKGGAKRKDSPGMGVEYRA